jgi:hypothetical protein
MFLHAHHEDIPSLLLAVDSNLSLKANQYFTAEPTPENGLLEARNLSDSGILSKLASFLD